MALNLSEGRSFTPCPAGLHDAVCISVVDLGMQQSVFGIKPKVLLQFELPNGGRPSSRVTSRHLDHGRSSRVFISRSNRPYGLTCSQISGVRAA